MADEPRIIEMPSLDWKISEETIREIKEIKAEIRRAWMEAQRIWTR